MVRAIFKWKLEGMSQGRIADKLNMQGVLCPMEYKISLGMKVQTNLTNEIYTGVLVQGKSGTPNYKVKKVMPEDEDEWIRVEDLHHPHPLFRRDIIMTWYRDFFTAAIWFFPGKCAGINDVLWLRSGIPFIRSEQLNADEPHKDNAYKYVERSNSFFADLIVVFCHKILLNLS